MNVIALEARMTPKEEGKTGMTVYDNEVYET